jgi:hypothetical protein
MPIPIIKGRPLSAPARHRARVRTNTMHGTASTGPRLTSGQPHTMPSLSHLACIRPTRWCVMQALLALISCHGHAHRVHRSHGSHVIRFSHSRAWVDTDACAHRHLKQLLALACPRNTHFSLLSHFHTNEKKVRRVRVSTRAHHNAQSTAMCGAYERAHHTQHKRAYADDCRGMQGNV